MSIKDEDPAAFLLEMKRAEAMLKDIRAKKSYVQQAWSLISRRMLVYLGVTLLMVWIEALVRPAIKIYSSKVMDDALEPDWEKKVLEDILVLIIGFIAQTWVVSIVHDFAEQQVEAEFEREGPSAYLSTTCCTFASKPRRAKSHPPLPPRAPTCL